MNCDRLRVTDRVRSLRAVGFVVHRPYVHRPHISSVGLVVVVVIVLYPYTLANDTALISNPESTHHL